MGRRPVLLLRKGRDKIRFKNDVICMYIYYENQDEIYEALLRMKREGESFSSVIERLLTGKKEKSLEVFKRYAGALEESELLDLKT